MSKASIPASIQDGLDDGTSSLAWGLRITRSDGELFSVTSADRQKVADTDTTFEPGLDVKALVQSAGYGVDNTELVMVVGDVVTRPDILAGKWDAATYYLTLFNWKQPTAGELVMSVGTIGDIRPRDGNFVAELRDLRQALQQDTTDTTQPDCRYRLGDAKCTLDITGAPFTMPFTVTVVSIQRYAFTDTARTEADDYFGAGEVIFDAPSPNAGLRFLVRTYESATDKFTLALPTPFPITPGDTGIAIAGCRKRHAEDCVAKFSNGINHGGEPHKARVDFLLRGAQ